MTTDRIACVLGGVTLAIACCATPTSARSPGVMPPPSGPGRPRRPPSGGGSGFVPTFGRNVRVNANPATFSRPQAEPSIASNPRDTRKLVTSFTDLGSGQVLFDAFPGVAISRDGGATWQAPASGADLFGPPGFGWGARDRPGYLAAADSAVAWSLGQTVFVSVLGLQENSAPPSGTCANGGLYVYRSEDAGDHWTLPAGGPAVRHTETVFADKDYMAADANPASPFAGAVYLVWDDDSYSGCPQDFATNFVGRSIAFSRSRDRAAHWSEPVALANGCVFGPVPAVAANGDLYVAWFDCDDGDREVVRRSTDGGVTFEPAVVAAPGIMRLADPLVGSSFRTNSAPSLATDPVDADIVYLAWAGDNGVSQGDVFVVRSLDGGGTWSRPSRVNDDPLDNPRDQFFPWIAVRGDGTVRVMWGDDRLDSTHPGGKLYDAFVADSFDHGASFRPNRRVSEASSNPDDDGFGGTFIGDYFGLARSGMPAWDDTQSGNQDIFGAPPDTAGCTADCDADGRVSVSELIAVIDAALFDRLPPCPLADPDGDGALDVADLVIAVDAALGECGVPRPAARALAR